MNLQMNIQVKNPMKLMKLGATAALLGLALISHTPLIASESQEEAESQRIRDEQMQARQQEARTNQERAMRDIEASRLEAERAAEQARSRAEQLRHDTERLRADAEAMAEQSESEREQQFQEINRMREELSRTHRELRRASQEVAKAHRDLTLANDRRQRGSMVNLGDRVMLGVILGGTASNGIRIVGLSPDGPAERAGMETGDVLISLGGESLAAENSRKSYERVTEILLDLPDGEAITARLQREDKEIELTVRPEKREPSTWASYIRLPDPPLAPDAPGATAAPNAPVAPVAPVIADRIVVPPLDVAELAAEAQALAREFESLSFQVKELEGDPSAFAYSMGNYEFEFDTETFSQLGEVPFEEARVWFGSPATLGIRFVELNEGLQKYFDADRGVLVIDAPKDNVLGLEAGDVVIKIGEGDINAIADIVRALRDFDTGDAFQIGIKRDKKNRSYEVVMPDNRLGLMHRSRGHDPVRAGSLREVAPD
jgi:C-terminal processing protease CtpA/Prc